MQLVEQHLIKSNNPFYKECDALCFKSKNLYNACLYKVRQEFIVNQTNILLKSISKRIYMQWNRGC